MESNEPGKDDVCYRQPRSLAERLAIANDFARRHSYSLPLVVDDMDNAADQLFAGWPERLYIPDEQGRVAYKGETGPFGFKPAELEQSLILLLQDEAGADKSQARAEGP